MLEHCGRIDAEHIEEYIATGGYQALIKALFSMTPDQVIDEVSESNLRGRGGRRIQDRIQMEPGGPPA